MSGDWRTMAASTRGHYSEHGASARSARDLSLIHILHRLCCWWIQTYGTVRAVEFGVLQVREGRDKLSKEGRGPATTNRYLSALRSAWNWARSAGLVPTNQLFPSRVMLTEPRGRTRFLSDDELAKLLKACLLYTSRCV